MQKAENFYYGASNPHGPTIEQQINNYISANQGCRVSSVGYAIGGSFEKALVIFEFREEKRDGGPQGQKWNSEKRENRKNPGSNS